MLKINANASKISVRFCNDNFACVAIFNKLLQMGEINDGRQFNNRNHLVPADVFNFEASVENV